MNILNFMPSAEPQVDVAITKTLNASQAPVSNDCTAWLSLRSGDENALLTIYDSCFDTLYANGFGLSKDSSVTEDCIQDIFLELWEKKSRLPEVKFVKAYLLKILKRKLIKVTSRLQTFEWHVDEVNVGLIDESSEDLIIADETHNSTNSKLQCALSKLTKRQREIINLKFFNELSYDEIAAFTGLSQQRIYNLVHDAVRELRTYLFSLQRHVAIFFLAVYIF